MFDSFTVIEILCFVGLIWLFAVNDINIVYIDKNQTKSPSPFF